MSDLNDIYSNELNKETGRQTRPRVLINFRRESFGSVASHKSEISDNFRSSFDTETQTDWSWLQDMELINRIKRDGAEIFEEIVNDLAQSSDSETEPEIKIPSPKVIEKPIVESVGPPKILQFNSEIKKAVITPSPPSPPLSIDSEPINDLGQFMNDFNVHLKGGQKCEFCGEITKPWPSINEQETDKPETLHCCNDYQEFVEALIQYQIEKEQANKETLAIDKESKIKNAKARKLAEEKAEIRNMQRMLEKHKRMERIENLKLEKQQLQQQLQAKQLNIKNEQIYQDFEHNESNRVKSQQENNNNHHHHPPDQHHRNHSSSTKKLKNTSAHATSKLSYSTVENISDLDSPFSPRDNLINQNRSINYQLSNLKYLEDGWTVRPSSPIDLDFQSINEEEFNLNAREVADPVVDKNYDRPLIIRKYKNDTNCIIMFPDGTGNVFYPSGRIAISITEISPGMHLLSAFSDDETNSTLIASFDPYGNACANFLNGRARMILSSLGGLELDADGYRKKRWLWKEQDEHVHAPPLQPLIFSLNYNISIKVINQEKINVHFYAENQIFKFRVGSKIKIKRPETMPASFKVELSELYLKKKRKRIDDLMKQMHSEINFGVKLPRLVNPKGVSLPKTSQSIDFLKNSRDKKTEISIKKQSQKSTKFITVP